MFKLILPEPEEIRELIKEAGFTRAEAAEMIHVSRRQLSKWLAPTDSQNLREMPLAAFELLLIKIGKHPFYKKIEE